MPGVNFHEILTGRFCVFYIYQRKVTGYQLQVPGYLCEGKNKFKVSGLKSKIGEGEIQCCG